MLVSATPGRGAPAGDLHSEEVHGQVMGVTAAGTAFCCQEAMLYLVAVGAAPQHDVPVPHRHSFCADSWERVPTAQSAVTVAGAVCCTLGHTAASGLRAVGGSRSGRVGRGTGPLWPHALCGSP